VDAVAPKAELRAHAAPGERGRTRLDLGTSGERLRSEHGCCGERQPAAREEVSTVESH
jgi:hypothetical protein